MLKTRIITAVIGVPILLGGLFLGGNYWRGLVILLALTALLEYMSMMRRQAFKPIVIPACMITLLLLFRVDLNQYLAGLFFAVWLLMIMFVVLNYPRFNYSDLAMSFFGAFYSGYLFSYALAVPEVEGTFLYVLLSLILTWASDIGGYLFGIRWGKHKLSPQLSPGKTWEGAMGAILLTIISAICFKYIFSMEYLNLFYTILLGFCASGAAQLGDLLESALKRYFGVKDSGHLIPGHGGVLDRFDSLMLVLPAVYYLLVVFV